MEETIQKIDHTSVSNLPNQQTAHQDLHPKRLSKMHVEKEALF
jgi:hypothetical protein